MIERVKGAILQKMHRLIIAVLDYWYRKRAPRMAKVSWVIGPTEIATMVSALSAVVPGSVTAVFEDHPFYEKPYDFSRPETRNRLADLRWKWFVLPALFVRLAYTARGFIYVSSSGYLVNFADQREFELSFLHERGVKIVFFFTGSDIRSPRLMRELELETGSPNLASYLNSTNPVFASAEYDFERKRVGELADRFADEIFTYRRDQRGYLERPSKPFRYLIPDDRICDDLSRFDAFEVPVLLHAPSSPIIKGTPLVRSAIAALRDEGFEFEYVELSGVGHDAILEQLARAHIVLNQFYSFVPGVFGVEAMAAGCVVLQSADTAEEPDLPAGSNEAWVVTKHWQVYQHLKELLSHPARMRPQAEAGQAWVREHASYSASGAVLREILDNVSQVSR